MSASYLASAEADLSCSICLELFVDPHTPKQLDCPHVYCCTCLTTLVEGGKHTIKCPQCRVITRVPYKTSESEGGVGALKTSFQLRNLAENHLKHTKDNPEPRHPSTSSAKKSSEVLTCLEHDGEKMHFYCVTCQVVACQACVLLDHDKTKHEIRGVKETVKEKLTDMEDMLKRAKNDVVCYEKEAKYVAGLQEDIKKAMTATENDIERAAIKAKAIIDKHAHTLKAQLKEVNEPQIQRYQKQEEELNRAAQCIRQAITDVNSAVENTNFFEYLKQHDLLEEQIKNSQSVKIHIKGKDIMEDTFKTFKMVPTPIRGLGDIVPVRKLNLKQSIAGFRHFLCGIGAGKGGVLAVATNSVDGINVLVYSKHSASQYTHKFNLTLTKNTDYVWDVAVAANGNFLAARIDYVEIYSTSGEYEGTIHTTQDKNTWGVFIRSITTTPDGRIIIGDEGGNVITLHTPDGYLVKTISVCFEPHRIAAVKNAHVAMCDRDKGKVCVIDLQSGRETCRIDIQGVGAVCYDKENDCLLVAANSLIQQYCVNTGKLLGCFDKNFNNSHKAITFLERGVLAVGLWNDVQIYDII